MMLISTKKSPRTPHLIDIVTGVTHDSDSIITDMPETEQADLLDSLEDNLQAHVETDPVHCSPEQLITNLSKINVVRNEITGGLPKQSLKSLQGPMWLLARAEMSHHASCSSVLTRPGAVSTRL